MQGCLGVPQNSCTEGDFASHALDRLRARPIITCRRWCRGRPSNESYLSLYAYCLVVLQKLCHCQLLSNSTSTLIAITGTRIHHVHSCAQSMILWLPSCSSRSSRSFGCRSGRLYYAQMSHVVFYYHPSTGSTIMQALFLALELHHVFCGCRGVSGSIGEATTL